MNFWQDKKVLVTGGNGFLGLCVVKKLSKRGCQHIITPRSKDFDLRETDDMMEMVVEKVKALVCN